MTTIIPPGTHQVRIPAEQVVLAGELTFPEQPHGLVLFVNGTGTAGINPANQHLAADLNAAGLATLVFDLRSHDERQRMLGPYDVATLAERLLSVTEWAALEADTGQFQVGYFASGAGAGPALVAAARAGHKVHALVLRGGHPEMAETWLSEVVAPTLLLVRENDADLYRINHEAETHLRCPHRLAAVTASGQHFEEAEVNREAVAWFAGRLRRAEWACGYVL